MDQILLHADHDDLFFEAPNYNKITVDSLICNDQEVQFREPTNTRREKIG